MTQRQSFPFEGAEQLNVTKTLWFIVLQSGLAVMQLCMDSMKFKWMFSLSVYPHKSCSCGGKQAINKTCWWRLNSIAFSHLFVASLLCFVHLFLSSACFELNMFLASLRRSRPSINDKRPQSPQRRISFSIFHLITPNKVRLCHSRLTFPMREISSGDKEASLFIAWMCACGWKPYCMSLHNRSCRLCTRWHYPL